jgi:hypothetical protein
VSESLISKDIENHFGFLFDHGFRIRSVKYFPQHMGNWIAILNSPECQIKISRDRGEIRLSLGSHSEETEQMWFGLRTVIFYLSKGKNYISIYEGELREKDKQFERLAKILAEYIDNVISIMGRDFEKHRLNLEMAKKQVFELDTHRSSNNSS